MEQRLIDANALKVSYCKQCLKETRNEEIEIKHTPYCAVACQDFDVIDKQPTVDAVPVVRCRECKHRGFHRNASCFDQNETIIEFPENSRCPLIPGAIIMPDEFFCAEGEK